MTFDFTSVFLVSPNRSVAVEVSIHLDPKPPQGLQRILGITKLGFGSKRLDLVAPLLQRRAGKLSCSRFVAEQKILRFLLDISEDFSQVRDGLRASLQIPLLFQFLRFCRLGFRLNHSVQPLID